MPTDSNRAALAFVKESTWGVKPATAYTDLRFTSEALTYGIENVVSEEINSNRDVQDLIQVGSDAGGPINFELSYNTFDEFLLATLCASAWPSDLAISSSGIDADGTDDYFSCATGTLNSIVAGQWIEVRGFTETANNGYFHVASVTLASGLDDYVFVDASLTTEAAGDAVEMFGSYIRNGTTKNSYCIERSLNDASEFFNHLGMMVNQLNLTVAAQAVISGSFDFIGKAVTRDTSTHGTGTNTAAATTEVMNAVANVAELREGGFETDMSVYVNEVSLTVNNNLRGINAVGHLGNAAVGLGSFEASGSLAVYFEDGDIYDKYLAGTSTSLSFKIEDDAGNAYIFTFPTIKLETDDIQAEGRNTDVMENLTWRAIKDTTHGCTMQVDKFAA